MQFDPDRYPVKDFVFLPVSTLGMVAREYEQQQMMGLMSTLGAQSPIVPMLLQGVIQGSSISNREEIVAGLQQMSQPDPMQQQIQQITMATAEANLQKTQAEAAKAMAEAEKAKAQAAAVPLETQAKVVTALNKDASERNDFEKTVKIAELALKEKEIENNLRVVEVQMADKQIQRQKDIEFKNKFA
jgi:hypothetical protein